ncbi:MAG TPA: NAD(P)/FAD-dependent oxidoreductase [Chloroflexota bacterium]|nr:NAD(P)/FAD-dependent oxidoreductase [Chloroflexota bacterium]
MYDGGKHYDYDAVVVGARCAGATTAMLMARKGYRVLLLDRARFPSEIPQGHFIHRHGPPRLQRWGLLDRIVASGCPPVTTMTSHFGDFPLVASNLVLDGVAFAYGPRRGVLDKLLVDAAVQAGVELREGFVFEDVLVDGGRVAGIRGRSTGGASPVTVRARLTIGADGRRSRVARAVKAPEYEATAPLACWYFSYWSGLQDRGLEMHVLKERRAIFAHPTNDGLHGVFVGWPIEEFEAVRQDIEGHALRVLDLAPGLGERIRAGRREERFYGTADVPNFLRQPCGPGWALVGDAGCHKDPFLALGVCDALRDAELLAEAADEGLSGRRPLEEALASYERRRNEATLPDFRENLEAARFGPPPPEVTRLRLALRDRPADATRFMMAREGMIPRQAFFNPENLQRILGGAPVRPTPPRPAMLAPASA